MCQKDFAWKGKWMELFWFAVRAKFKMTKVRLLRGWLDLDLFEHFNFFFALIFNPFEIFPIFCSIKRERVFFSRKTLAIVGIRTQTLIRVAFEYKALLACQIVVIQQKQPGGFVKQSFKNIIFKPQSCLLNGAVIRKSSYYISLHYRAPLKQSPSAI